MQVLLWEGVREIQYDLGEGELYGHSHGTMYRDLPLGRVTLGTITMYTYLALHADFWQLQWNRHVDVRIWGSRTLVLEF